MSVGPLGEGTDSGATGAASRVGECAALVGLLDAEGCTGNDMEKRFVRGAAFCISVATVDIVDMVLLWLWKLALSNESVDGVGLLGEDICSTGLGLAAMAPERWRIP